MSLPSYAVSVTQTPTPPDYDEASFDQDAIGKDLLFTSDLQLGSHGDYLLIGGRDRVRQRLLLRLVIAPGEYKLRTSFGVGVPNYLRRPMSESELAALERQIREQLSAEPLIERLNAVRVAKVTRNGVPGIQVHVVVRAIGTERNYGFLFQER